MTMMKTYSQQFAVLLLAVILMFGVSCQKEQRAKPIPTNLNKYVYAYTTGLISKQSPIRVRFTSPVIDEDAIGGDALKYIAFQPRVQGAATWEDRQTLLFQPDEAFESGQSYISTVQLQGLLDNLPKELHSFQFEFKIKEQGFNVQVDGLLTALSGQLKDQELLGTISTYDVAENAQIEALLTAFQFSKPLSIEWQHEEASTKHAFTVKGIQRTEQGNAVELKWNGNALDVDQKGNKLIDVPALGDFKVIKASINRENGNPYVELLFSDPLQKDQDLTGLVRIKEYQGNYDFIIERNRLNVYPKTVLRGKKTLEVSSGVLNIEGTKMAKTSLWDVHFDEIKPQVRLVRQGVIMPNSNGLIYPFEAVSLNAVDIEVFKIFDNNMKIEK